MSDSPKAAVLTPRIDALCVGGLSVLLIFFVLLTNLDIFTGPVLEEFVIFSVLLNAPHFMASYRLLYSSKTMVRKYLGASLYVPLLLAAYGVFALWYATAHGGNVIFIEMLVLVVGIYLAFHYTGQVWGMMASFSYLERCGFEAPERNMLKFSLQVLCLWQIAWTFAQGASAYAWVPKTAVTIYEYSHIAFLFTVPVVIYTLFKFQKRIARRIPLRVWLPLFSLYMWYILLYRHPHAIFWVQLSHALQYLIFPLRVEINRNSGLTRDALFKHIFFYCITMLVSGWLVFYGFEMIVTWKEPGFAAYATVLTAIVNIHHFYTDGCIWKISNPEVRKDLFAHVKTS